MLKKIFLISSTGLLLFMVWFAVSNYRDAYPIAEENLNGLALSLTAAIENMIVRDPTLHTLSTLHANDIAFFALIDQRGFYRFHSNSDLIDTPVQEPELREVLKNKTPSGSRILLGTGEIAYAFTAPLHLPGEALLLRLTLHTYRADTVIRKAKMNMTILLSLLATGFILSLLLYRFAIREKRHQLEMARRVNLVKLGELGATLAHEIRNPLAGIKGYAQMIVKKPADPRNSGFAGLMVKEVLRLEKLVENLLAYAKNEPYSLAPLDSAELISSVLPLLHPEAEQAGIKIIQDASPGLIVRGNRDKLIQVLLNLGKNAIQAMPAGGTLRITAGASGKSVIITLSDSGQGIDEKNLPQVFEPFFTTRARGTGLGLTLCRKIVEEQDGSINLTSAPGEGTSVAVILPGAKSGNRKGTRS